MSEKPVVETPVTTMEEPYPYPPAPAGEAVKPRRPLVVEIREEGEEAGGGTRGAGEKWFRERPRQPAQQFLENVVVAVARALGKRAVKVISKGIDWASGVARIVYGRKGGGIVVVEYWGSPAGIQVRARAAARDADIVPDIVPVRGGGRETYDFAVTGIVPLSEADELREHAADLALLAETALTTFLDGLTHAYPQLVEAGFYAAHPASRHECETVVFTLPAPIVKPELEMTASLAWRVCADKDDPRTPVKGTVSLEITVTGPPHTRVPLVKQIMQELAEYRPEKHKEENTTTIMVTVEEPAQRAARALAEIAEVLANIVKNVRKEKVKKSRIREILWKLVSEEEKKAGEVPA